MDADRRIVRKMPLRRAEMLLMVARKTNHQCYVFSRRPQSEANGRVQIPLMHGKFSGRFA